MMAQPNILIVDDENHLRLSLSLILQKENYCVDTAASAEEALVYLKAHEYDLMFLDLSLPGMSGIDLLLEVHKQFPHIPVLILTAHAALESAIQAVRLGARDYQVRLLSIFMLPRMSEACASPVGCEPEDGAFWNFPRARRIQQSIRYFYGNDSGQHNVECAGNGAGQFAPA